MSNKILLFCIFWFACAAEAEKINIKSKQSQFFLKQNKVVFKEDVLIEIGKSSITAKQVELYNPSTPDKHKIFATGNPILYKHKPHNEPEMVIKADSFSFNKQLGVYVLSGHVYLKQGDNIVSGDTLTYRVDTGDIFVSANNNPDSFVDSSFMATKKEK